MQAYRFNIVATLNIIAMPLHYVTIIEKNKIVKPN